MLRLQSLSVIIFFLFIFSGAKAQKQTGISPIRVSLEKRLPSDSFPGEMFISNEIQEWNPNETAIIICDMWNQHWCKSATERALRSCMHPVIVWIFIRTIRVGNWRRRVKVKLPENCSVKISFLQRKM